MKKRNLSLILLFIYIVMQIGSVFLSDLLITYFKQQPTYVEIEAKYTGAAWALFIANAATIIVMGIILLRNRNYFNVFKGKKASLGQSVLWGFIGFFLALGGQIVAGSIENALGVPVGSENTALLSEIAKTAPVMIVSIVLFAPFLEELIFRRVIFGSLYVKTNFWIAALISGIIFAAVHNEFEHLLMYLVPGLVFSYLYYRTKRLLTPMIAHLLMNGFVTILQLNQEKIMELQKMKQAFIIWLL